MKILVISTFIIIYCLFAIFLNKFNNLLGNKKTIIAYLPIVNIYLLGKLAVNDLFGVTMALYFIVANGTYNITFDGIIATGEFLTGSFGIIMKIIYDILLMIVIIYSLYKYFYMKKKFNNPLVLVNKEKKINNRYTKKESNNRKIQRKDTRKEFNMENDSFFNPFK